MEGELAVIEDNVRIATISEPESVVGELSHLIGTTRSATLKAETDCRLKVVEDVDAFFREDPDHGLEIARLLARRLHEMDEKFLEIRDLLKKAGGEVPEDDETLSPELAPFRRFLKSRRLNL
jgi:CRP-like cAMP-binding protein